MAKSISVNEGEIETILSGRLSPIAMVEKTALFKNNTKKMFPIKKTLLFNMRFINFNFLINITLIFESYSLNLRKISLPRVTFCHLCGLPPQCTPRTPSGWTYKAGLLTYGSSTLLLTFPKLKPQWYFHRGLPAYSCEGSCGFAKLFQHHIPF